MFRSHDHDDGVFKVVDMGYPNLVWDYFVIIVPFLSLSSFHIFTLVHVWVNLDIKEWIEFDQEYEGEPASRCGNQ